MSGYRNEDDVMLDELKDYDWGDVFAFAGEKECDSGNARGSMTYPATGERGSPIAVRRRDVKRIIESIEGENDGNNWEIVFTFQNPHEPRTLYGYITAGCDYTGWGCQAGGAAFYAESLFALCNFAIGDDTRLRIKKAYSSSALTGGLVEENA